ncbi:unnamed protein product [Zymoseptoria tritici ST99CH_3D7]|uniref:PQ-loop repeat-containing protein 1 n=1 Tax=Zymoseptoria tritici (strain ST99CH_3D7) TaxID=1276538 RepID=A0A1X7S148_ZYMT9|nr:unnamed protein product [Zymoseptoria tritici ST99CH_3D7]
MICASNLRPRNLLSIRVMSFVAWTIKHIAPLFLITSPVTSYADQIWSMHKKRSSAGFSLDVPLIMLVASITKVFYWFGSRYDIPLLIQAGIAIFVQFAVLHVALLHRPAFGAQHSIPFAGAGERKGLANRPFKFWQWRSRKPYWEFLFYYSITLAALQMLIGSNQAYIAFQGYFALSVEAVLPLPQIMENYRSRSCKGFRLSILVNWLIGDAFKMTYFFLSDGSAVPWAFKLCGIFQAVCDCYLGVQYWMYGEGEQNLDIGMRDQRLA